MEKAYPLSTPMVVRALDIQKDPFRPPEEGEIILGPETPYLSSIGALMYLVYNTRPDIAFVVNLLARYSFTLTQRRWKGVKNVLHHLQGTTGLGLFYLHESSSNLTGFANTEYLFDPLKGRSQTRYIFSYNSTAIIWRSTKKTLTTTLSNHAEILALHEASRECQWLRSMIGHTQSSCK
ncbi:secreted RxLR effector protein 161-like [Dioscorea cayenensis subsp. rotundata]|uniref:Secreted RxLR effector protein 161-like n=1 Tax=Dioscorea cayennensis subsp. rotundata TaxID=55577 RepID=A0AB40D036_DIOCR|nr:secreted RxLR effector protein 161-like [Dioscorea cayenensis subsp. rotundata]